MAVNDAVLAVALFQQKDTTNGTKLRDEAIAYSDKITTEHPNIVTYWKSRVRVFYTLSQLDPQYLNQALLAIEKASQLAPTDAKVWYNLGLLYAQTGHIDNAIATEKKTIVLKADYRDAYYALALFYRQKAIGADPTAKTVTDRQSEEKAVDTMHFILDNFGPDQKITDTLSSWGEK
jgi:tetratricopeptide (TPR) repeat protein